MVWCVVEKEMVNREGMKEVMGEVKGIGKKVKEIGKRCNEGGMLGSEGEVGKDGEEVKKVWE